MVSPAAVSSCLARKMLDRRRLSALLHSLDAKGDWRLKTGGTGLQTCSGVQYVPVYARVYVGVCSLSTQSTIMQPLLTKHQSCSDLHQRSSAGKVKFPDVSKSAEEEESLEVFYCA